MSTVFANVRDWNVFFRRDGFNWPRDREHLNQRLESNLAFYQSNYLCVVLVCLLLVGIKQPLIFIGYGASYMAFNCMDLPVIKDQVVDMPILYAWSRFIMGSFICFYVLGGQIFGKATVITVIAILAHMVFRKRQMVERVNQFFSKLLDGCTTDVFSTNEMNSPMNEPNPNENEQRSKQEQVKINRIKEAMKMRREDILKKYN